MGPIWVLYGQKSLYGAHVGPEWDKWLESAHMIPIYTRLLVEFYQYGTYMGLIWAKKPIWGPCRTQMGQMPRFCPYGSHIYMFAGYASLFNCTTAVRDSMTAPSWNFNQWVWAWRFVFGLARCGPTTGFHLLCHPVELTMSTRLCLS